MARENQNEQIIVGSRPAPGGVPGGLQPLSDFELGSLTAENWQMAYSQAFAEMFGADGVDKKEYDRSQALRSRLSRYRSRLLLTFTGQDVDYQSAGGADDPNADAREREFNLGRQIYRGPGTGGPTTAEDDIDRAIRDLIGRAPGSIVGTEYSPDDREGIDGDDESISSEAAQRLTEN